MAELVVYPDAHPETSSVDGYVMHEGSSPEYCTWADLISGAGTACNESDEWLIAAGFTSHWTSENKWLKLQRGIFLFDTSSLPNETVITGAVFSIYGTEKSDELEVSPNINVYSSAPASDTELVAGDFDSLGSVAFCDTPITYAGWNDAGYNDFILNAAGLAAISKTGITKLGTRNANYDVAGIQPSWASGGNCSRLSAATSESAHKPKLTITYAAVVVPTVTTDDATVLGRTTYADLNGTLDDDGYEACDCGFEWGETDAYGNTTSTQSKTTGQSFSKTITGLSSNTTYHFRAIATNSAGTDYGDNKTFTTTTPGEAHMSTLRLSNYDCRAIWYPTRRTLAQCTVLCADDLLLKTGAIDTQTAATIKAAIEEARDDATWPITFYDPAGGDPIYVHVLSARYRFADVTKEKNKGYVFDLLLQKVPLE